MAKPKLALIPATIGSKVFSVLPSDGSGDFDFTRASAATRINKDGLIETVASGDSRLEYPMFDGVVSGCPSLLLEPQRTNLITYSSGFVTDWNNTNITINSNSIISPDGSLNGTKFIPTTTSGGHYLDRSGIVVNSNASASVFAKKGGYNRLAIRSYYTNAYAIFDVNEGLIILESSVTAKIENYGNGWYRCSLNEALDLNYGYGIFVMEDASTTPTDTYVGNGADGMYFYGAQLEEGSYPTSYIPTNGTTVTRLADTANGAGDATTFNDSEGVLMLEASTLVNGADVRISLSDGGSTNKVEIEWDALANTIKAFMYTDGSITTSSYNQTLYLKIAVLYKLNNFKMYINGFLIDTDITASNVSGLNQLNFAKSSGANDFYGKVKQIQYFDTALNDSDLEELTSWDSFVDMSRGQLYTIK